MSEHRSKKHRRPQNSGRSRLHRDNKYSDVALITTARKSPLEHWNHRRRMYFFLQGLRIPLILLAALLVWVTNNMMIGVAVAAISVPLPWIAVLLANETNDPDKNEPKVYKPAVVREQRRQQEQQQALTAGAEGPNQPKQIEIVDLSDNSGDNSDEERPEQP